MGLMTQRKWEKSWTETKNRFLSRMTAHRSTTSNFLGMGGETHPSFPGYLTIKPSFTGVSYKGSIGTVTDSMARLHYLIYCTSSWVFPLPFKRFLICSENRETTWMIMPYLSCRSNFNLSRINFKQQESLRQDKSYSSLCSFYYTRKPDYQCAWAV